MSTARFPVRAVLFDLDGTLLDTIHDLADAANLMLGEVGRPARPLEQIHSFVGKGIPNLVRRCMTEDAEAGEDEIEQAVAVFRRHYADVNGRSTRIYPGVIETLEAMRAMELRLACVTNKAEAFTLPLLERMGLTSYFGAVVSGDTLPVKKPDPAVLHHACELLGVRSPQALMIGDSANDALAARGAGMPVLLVTYGYSEGMAVDTIECDGLLSTATGALDRIEAA
ncbi:phosphoglycolate phosphatase [Aromatoleum toluclasticum]|uniref:phosphoglycolate phosphatase n=1 Tax=Aromatoleum toluclasticum TaxID=92003 RepID=UPI001D191FFC|nr:phosphoglycolate phosphatase [Aromatoleum toluclasticum]MCC4116290.1 phosphoglycolate phosphatase [Aromatoleum toluclasticum]